MKLSPLKYHLLTAFLWHAASSYVVHPNGPGGKSLGSSGSTTKSDSSPFQCSQVTTVTNADEDDEEVIELDCKSVLSELFQDWKEPSSNENGLAFLFISPQWAPHLENIAQTAQERIGDESKTQLITIVGGGVVGGGIEEQNSAGMSFIGGILPKDSSVNIFYGTDGENKKLIIPDTSSDNNDDSHTPSHLVFADPLCSQLHDVLDKLGSDIVAGGISIGEDKEPSLAIGSQVLPPGSLVGASFSGNLGLQVIVSHGCRPVGPTYRVTSVNGAAVHELNDMPALEQLQDTIQRADSKDQELFHRLGVLGGIYHQYHDEEEVQQEYKHEAGDDVKLPEDFILREVNGFRPRSGSIMVCGPQIQKGDFFRFHVRSSETALQDWQSVLKRARTERIFLGNQAGRPLGAVQISCMGRGQGLFEEEKNVDLKHVQALMNRDDLPIAGLFANAEIGPVRLRMGAPGGVPNLEKAQSYLHGYSTVVAMLCDYSKIDADSVEEIMPGISCLGNSTLDMTAWG
jgi:small ligand-binding sensory domain FIST